MNIQLQEIRYQQNTDHTVAAAMNEITDTKTNHLNPDTITAETPSLDVSGDETSAHINELLGEVVR